tara:strand:- start:129551 stop:129934 length:384 start_codon:yes stop_codon:yes gene_type:complete
MRSFKGIAILVIGLLLVASCGSSDKGQKFADKFFKLAIQGDYEKAGTMLEEKPNTNLDPVAAVESFANSPKYGKLKSAKKGLGFNTNINNGVTTIKLPYSLVYENGEYNTNVTIIDRGMGMKISYIE